MTGDLRMRPATSGDAEAVFDLVVARDLAELGEVDDSIEGVTSELARPTAESWVATRGDDPALVGSCVTNVRPASSHVDGGLVTRLGEPPALTQTLLDHVRRAAQDRAPDRPLHIEAAASNAVTHDVFTRSGATVVRHFLRMLVELGDVPPEVPPARAGGDDVDIEIDVVVDDEPHRRVLHHVLNTAFLEHFGSSPTTYEEWYERVSEAAGADPAMRWLATVDGEPAAAVVATRLPDYGYIPALGVLPDHRGHGLGRRLLLTAFRGLHERGARRVALHVDGSNPTGAVALYTSAGMHVQHDYAVYEFPPLG